MATKKAEQFQPSGDTKRVISCGGGTYVRIGDHRGKWHHLSVERDIDDIWHLLAEVDNDNHDLAVRIVNELIAVNAEFVNLWQVIDNPEVEG
jgi:hypothetical protein